MTATEAAARIQPGSPVRWRDLELAAFREHSGVVRALDPRGRRSAAARSPLRILRIVVVALVALCPVWSFASLLGGRFIAVQVDGETAIPMAAIFTTIGLAMPLWLAWRGLSDPAQRRGSLAGIGALYAGIGVVLGILVVARAEPGQSLALALVPFAATVLVGLVLVVAGALFATRGGDWFEIWAAVLVVPLALVAAFALGSVVQFGSRASASFYLATHADEMRRALGNRASLALAQIGAHLENRVTLRRAALRLQLEQQIRRGAAVDLFIPAAARPDATERLGLRKRSS